MNGWYSGCELPEAIDTPFYQAVMDDLDQNRRYGVFRISGAFSGELYTGMFADESAASANTYASKRKDNINNGIIEVTNASFGSSLVAYGISHRGLCEDSRNYAPIHVHNCIMAGNAYINGCTGGTHNINYADIEIDHVVGYRTNNTDTYILVSGVADHLGGERLENRGNISVHDCYEAEVRGKTWRSPGMYGFAQDDTGTNRFDVTYLAIGGIGRAISSDQSWHQIGIQDSVNFGTINVSHVPQGMITGGIVGYADTNATMARNLNYGSINVDDIGCRKTRFGGIAGYISTNCSITSCMNFADLHIGTMNTYTRYRLTGNSNEGNVYAQIGGITGNTGATASVSSCDNFGRIIYNNPNHLTDRSTTKVGAILAVGGIVGCQTTNFGNRSVMNYADIIVEDEPNMNLRLGGIVGYRTVNNDSVKRMSESGLINYGSIRVNYPNENRRERMIGGIVGCFTGMNPDQENESTSFYAINYGTIHVAVPQGISKSCLTRTGSSASGNSLFFGGLIGYLANYSRYYGGWTNIEGYADVSHPDSEWADDYVLIGGISMSTSENHAVEPTLYTDSPDTAARSATIPNWSGYGAEIYTVSIDNQPIDESAKTVGFFSTDFMFRRHLSHEITEELNHYNNSLMYREFGGLSPYLQDYFTRHFGTAPLGGYVAISGDRGGDRFVPYYVYHYDRDEETDELIKTFQIGYHDIYSDTSLIASLPSNNSVYDDYLLTHTRTVQSDIEYYAWQNDESAMAELYDMSIYTPLLYKNSDTSLYQHFYDYKTDVETYAAQKSDGTASETVLYTDVNLYMAIDDLDAREYQVPRRDEYGEFVRDEEGNIIYDRVTNDGTILLHGFTHFASDQGKIRFYTGDEQTYTDRDTTDMTTYRNAHDDLTLGGQLLNADTVDSFDFSDSNSWTRQFDIEKISRYVDDDYTEYIWEISVPWTNETDIRKVYTKVLGVITAEDGIHKNILTAHVIIDRYKPWASVDSLTLVTNTVNTSNAEMTVVSTEDNGGLDRLSGQYSKTDGTYDVSYFFASDAVLDTLTGIKTRGHNMQHYQNSGNGSLHITTHNMDEEGYVFVQVYRQDRLPSLSGTDYNDWENITWNNGKGTLIWSSKLNPVNVVYNESNQSTGEVIVTLKDSYYDSPVLSAAGLYRIDLCYERTKHSSIDKHFASVFFWKGHSPENLVLHKDFDDRYTGDEYTNNYTAKQSNGTYKQPATPWDSMSQADRYSHTGYLYQNIGTWAYNSLTFPSRDYNKNVSARNVRISARSRMADYPERVFYVDVDNPIYNDLEEDVPKGYQMSIDAGIESIDFVSDPETGAKYPAVVHMFNELISEDTQNIRRYEYDRVFCGWYYNGEDHTGYRVNSPTISISAATQEAAALASDDDGLMKGYILGDETEPQHFTVTWTSTNVSLFNRDYSKKESVYQTEIMNNDGYSLDYLDIYYCPVAGTGYRKLTAAEISQYFSEISMGNDNSNRWNFTVEPTAPAGNYKIQPYYIYHTDYSSLTAGTIKLYQMNDQSFETRTEVPTDGTNIFEWRIPYSSPFYIVSVPNDETYITQFENYNDVSVPIIIEDENNAPGGEDRDVFIVESSLNQDVRYRGYEGLTSGDERVDKFVISCAVGKEVQSSSLRINLPYMASLREWTGGGSPIQSDGTITMTAWTSLTPDDQLTEDPSYPVYLLDVHYNELLPDGTFSGIPAVKYYLSVAEDETTVTLYTVYVVPDVRNKSVDLMIANDINEVAPTLQDTLRDSFDESAALYEELLEKYGPQTVNIKELGNSGVLNYQIKMFDGIHDSDILSYNLKGRTYDISMDLPAGYTYDVAVFSNEMDGYQILKPSVNQYSGKRLLLPMPDPQNIIIRVLLRREASDTIWGVQFIWNTYSALLNSRNMILTQGGGHFDNFVN